MQGNVIGYVGALVGFCGWVIGLAIVCLLAGRADLTAPLVLPALGLSLGLGLAWVIMLEGLLRVHGRGPLLAAVAVGALLVDGGVLFLLLNHWIMPALEQDANIVAVMRKLGGMQGVPDAVPVALLAAGTLLLAGGALRMVRPATSS